MNDIEFYHLIDELWIKIENYIDNWSGNNDIDCEINGNVLTLSFENGNRIIINYQRYLYQVWLATIYNGYHFDFKDEEWICNRSGKNFWTIFKQALENETNKKIAF